MKIKDTFKVIFDNKAEPVSIVTFVGNTGSTDSKYGFISSMEVVENSDELIIIKFNSEVSDGYIKLTDISDTVARGIYMLRKYVRIEDSCGDCMLVKEKS